MLCTESSESNMDPFVGGLWRMKHWIAECDSIATERDSISSSLFLSVFLSVYVCACVRLSVFSSLCLCVFPCVSFCVSFCVSSLSRCKDSGDSTMPPLTFLSHYKENQVWGGYRMNWNVTWFIFVCPVFISLGSSWYCIVGCRNLPTVGFITS